MVDMNKRKLHHYNTKLKWLKPWYFLVLAIVSVAICVFALRANNQHMVTLRDKVYAADKANADVQTPLKDLQAYVTSHMNTNLASGNTSVYPPIQLKYTYDRLVAAQGEAATAANTKIYNDAQHYCEQQNSSDFSGRNRVPCIEQYVQNHNSQAPRIQQELYKFAFVTPSWSPDLAGWSMVLAVVSASMFVITFILKRVIK